MSFRRTATLNGATVIQKPGAVWVLLPKKLQTPIAGGCSCVYCSVDGNPVPAFWDTLCVPTDTNEKTAWTIHAPEAHGRTAFRTYAKKVEG